MFWFIKLILILDKTNPSKYKMLFLNDLLREEKSCLNLRDPVKQIPGFPPSAATTTIKCPFVVNKIIV